MWWQGLVRLALAVHGVRWAWLVRGRKGRAEPLVVGPSHPRYEATEALLCGLRRRHFEDAVAVDLAGGGTARVSALAPDVFRRLRRHWRCDGALSRRCRREGGAGSLEQQVGGGSRGAARRGNLFFETRGDRRFVFKQEDRTSAYRLATIAEDYERHVTAHPVSLLPRFVGVYEVQVRGETTYWLVMNNVFYAPGISIEARYDLKGSTAGRLASKTATTKKDLDAIRDRDALESRPRAVDGLVRIVDADAEFLQRHGLLDYSLLVGVSERPPSLVPFASAVRRLAFARGAPVRGVRVLPLKKKTARLPCVGPHRSLVVGLIDILQPFDTLKRLEYWARGAVRGFDAISAVPPAIYRRRLLAFLRDLFLGTPAGEGPPSGVAL